MQLTTEASAAPSNGKLKQPTLIKLTPQQVAANWGVLAGGILQGMRYEKGDDEEIVTARLLNSILRRYMDCWIIVPVANQSTILGVLTTLVTGDMYVGDRTLVIYSLYRYKDIEEDMWKDSFRTLREYAKANGCNKVIAYSEFDHVVKLAESLGANAKTRIIEWEV